MMTTAPTKRAHEKSPEPTAKKQRVDTMTAAGEIDEDLHSRQLAVYGRESMRRLAGASVLICGMRGLGAEIAKNVILAGVKAVTLQDTTACELSDLSAQFYLAEADVGANRATACAGRLQELNPAVAVTVVADEISDALCAKHQVVVCTDVPLERATAIDAFCHDNGIAFVRGDVRGVFGSLFCDFGPAFHVADTDGEEPHTCIVASVSNEATPMVTCVDDDRVELQDGQSVIFTEVRGMTELNDGKPRKIKNVKAHSFQLEEDTTSYGAYTGGGIATQVKETKTLKFKTLKDAMAELVSKVHPDLFASGPAGAGETNDESLKAIQTVLDSVTRDKTTPNAGIKRLKFFVMDDESPQGVRVVPFSFKTTGGDCRNLVAKQLKDVMAKVGTSSDFRWDVGDWEVRADAGYVARSQNPWSNVKGTSYEHENDGEDGSIETNRRRRGDLVAALKIADGLFEAIAAVPWIPEPQGDDRVRVINAEIVPRLAKEGWALDKDRVERIWRGERDDASVMDGLDAASGLALQAIVKHARAFDRAYGKPARERTDFYPK